MNENKQNLSWWKPGVEIFTQVSVWIVIPIVIALVFGKNLDAHFGTRPWIFITLAFLGFLFSCLGIVRVIKKYIKKLQDITPPSHKTTVDKEEI